VHQEDVVEKDLADTLCAFNISTSPDFSEDTVPLLNNADLAPFPFHELPILIAVDCEAWEHDPSIVTEIGVSTLDTRDIVGRPPNPGGEKWFDWVRSRHFLISEYKGFVNTRFISGCPDRFEFGRSETISKKDAAAQMTACFKHPFSIHGYQSEKPWYYSDGEEELGPEPEDRNVVFIGHDPKHDIAYLKRLGFELPSSVISIMDTAEIYRAYSGERSTRSIATILTRFGLSRWHLHNAGNDSTYTMRIFLGTAIRAASGDKDGSVPLVGMSDCDREE
jgi:hypothetical protein